MPGPSPKPGAVRQNKPTHEWINLPKSGNQDSPPELPVRCDAGVWSQLAKKLWAELWAKPESLLWDETCYHLAERYLYLHEKMWAGNLDGPTQTGMDKCESKLGLTPKDKVQLRWRIVPDAMADEDFRSEDPPARPNLASVEPIAKKRNVDY